MPSDILAGFDSNNFGIIDDETLKFAIFNALSDNRFKRLDISDARELLGYAPQDDLTRENPKLRALDLRETARAHNVRDPDHKSGAARDVRPVPPKRGARGTRGR